MCWKLSYYEILSAADVDRWIHCESAISLLPTLPYPCHQTPPTSTVAESNLLWRFDISCSTSKMVFSLACYSIFHHARDQITSLAFRYRTERHTAKKEEAAALYEVVEEHSIHITDGQVFIVGFYRCFMSNLVKFLVCTQNRVYSDGGDFLLSSSALIKTFYIVLHDSKLF